MEEWKIFQANESQYNNRNETFIEHLWTKKYEKVIFQKINP